MTNNPSCPICGVTAGFYLFIEGSWSTSKKFSCGYCADQRRRSPCKSDPAIVKAADLDNEESPAYEKRLIHMKPRIRLIFDENRNPSEVRIALNPPTSKQQTFDEFNGMVVVQADEKTQVVNTIQLNCKLLGGFDLAEQFVRLMAMMQSGGKKVKLPYEMMRTVQRAKELVGEERINLVAKKMEEEIKQKWGDLPELIRVVARDCYNEKKKQELVECILKSGKINEYLDYLIETQVEESTYGGGYVGGHIVIMVRDTLQSLPDKGLGYLVRCASEKNFGYVYWSNLLLQCVTDESAFDPESNEAQKEKILNTLKVYAEIYKGMLKNPHLDQNIQAPAENAEDENEADESALICRSAIANYCESLGIDTNDAKVREKITEFLTILKDKDPLPQVRKRASQAINTLKRAFAYDDEDEDADDFFSDLSNVDNPPSEVLNVEVQPVTGSGNEVAVKIGVEQVKVVTDKQQSEDEKLLDALDNVVQGETAHEERSKLHYEAFKRKVMKKLRSPDKKKGRIVELKRRRKRLTQRKEKV